MFFVVASVVSEWTRKATAFCRWKKAISTFNFYISVVLCWATHNTNHGNPSEWRKNVHFILNIHIPFFVRENRGFFDLKEPTLSKWILFLINSVDTANLTCSILSWFRGCLRFLWFFGVFDFFRAFVYFLLSSFGLVLIFFTFSTFFTFLAFFCFSSRFCFFSPFWHFEHHSSWFSSNKRMFFSVSPILFSVWKILPATEVKSKLRLEHSLESYRNFETSQSPTSKKKQHFYTFYENFNDFIVNFIQFWVKNCLLGR